MDKLVRNKLFTTLLAILCGFFVAGILLQVTGYNSLEVFAVLMKGIFGHPKSIANIIIKATPIIITGVSVSFAFKVGLFNIGVEGQYTLGAVFSVIMGLMLKDAPLPGVILTIFIIIAGIMAGSILGGIVGFLKSKFGIHEVITSIMFNWIAFYFSNLVVYMKAFHRPDSMSTYTIPEKAFTMVAYSYKTSPEGREALSKNPFLRDVVLRTDLNYGIIFAIIVAIIIYYILKKTTLGYQLMAVGLNKDAAEFAGINVNKNIILAMVISGAIAGLAGALMITGTGPHRITTLGAPENYGFNGLSVALIAGSNPIGCIFAGLLFAALTYGGGTVQAQLGAPTEIINIMIGTVILFIALSSILPIIVEQIEAKRKYSKGGNK